MSIEKLKKQIAGTKAKLVSHPLYTEMKSLEDVQSFMQHHIFAVWDFMSLVKYLQRELTCVSLPWMPKGSAQTRFLINEIVLGEESDVDQNGVRTSHFELYLKAMNEAGADTTAMRGFLNKLNAEQDVAAALNDSNLPASVQDFVKLTFHFIEQNKLHVVAGVFTFGREDLIPAMFTSLVNELNHDGALDTFRYYLERHIEVDGDHHSQLAYEMLAELCGEDELKWQEASQAIQQSLQARIALWDGVLTQLLNVRSEVLQ